MNPKKVLPGRAKRRKPIHGGLNLNSLSLGELLRLYDNEKRMRGSETRYCVALRSAIDKAKGFEGPIMDDKKDNKLNMQAAAKRWPLSAATKKLAVQTACNLMEADCPKAQASGVSAIIAFERQNQADDHHADPQKIEHSGKITLQASEYRKPMLEDPEYLEFLREKAMREQPKLNGVDHAAN